MDWGYNKILKAFRGYDNKIPLLLIQDVKKCVCAHLHVCVEIPCFE